MRRERAAEIARLDAIAHQLGSRVLAVVMPREIVGREPMLYMADLHSCWVAYIEQTGAPRICSSTIVVIDCSSGNVIYRGSANDGG